MLYKLQNIVIRDIKDGKKGIKDGVKRRWTICRIKNSRTISLKKNPKITSVIFQNNNNCLVRLITDFKTKI